MTLSVTINGMTVQVEPDMTVLEAARAHDIYIPTLCYAPKLQPAGACRMCVVEIENMRGFPTACTVPVSDGMVVRTETEAVQNLRREVLSLILSEHPYTCLVCQSDCADFQGTIRKAAVTTGCQYCPANGQCELQNLVDYLDLREIPYPIFYRGLPVEQDDPFFDRDYNLCILCGRCVRVCQEIRHSGVLAFVKRGSETIVGTAFGRSHLEADCQFCGACVDVCPVGALADKRGKWEGVPTTIVPSVCPYCSVGCAVNMQVKDGKLIRAMGHEDGPTNDGQLCVRGRFGMVDVVHDLTRLRAPMVRRNGRLVEVSWDEALNVVKQSLGQYRPHPQDEPHPSAEYPKGDGTLFALVASATATNEENYALQKFARTVMHSNNVALAADFPSFRWSPSEGWVPSHVEYPQSDGPHPRDGVASPCHELTQPMGPIRALKTIGGPTIRDVRHATCILVIGTNLFESHPILGLEIRHALSNGASLITLDARQTRLAEESDVWLQPKVATDHVLLAGITKALADQGWITAEDPQGDGDLDLDQVTVITGVSQEAIIMAARQLAERLTRDRVAPSANAAIPSMAHPSMVIIYGSGVTHHPTATEVIEAIHNLAFLLAEYPPSTRRSTRGVRVKGDEAFTAGKVGIISVTGEGNFVGAHDMGVHPAQLPGYRSISDPEARATFETAWGVTLNPNPGRSYEAILDGIRDGQIRALYLAGEMPPLPELSNLDFLVVQDIVSTETMQYAHVVLPATTFAEMDGTLTNLEGRVQRVRQAIPPVGLSRPGWMIVRDVARSMGNGSPVPRRQVQAWDYQSAAQVMAEIATLVPAYAHVSHDTLNVGGVLRRFELVAKAQSRIGARPIRRMGSLPTGDTGFSLDGVPHLTNDQFPLTLITERNLFYYHSACLTEQVRGMNLIKQEEILYLNPEDASQLGVSDQDLVKVVSPYGSSECIARIAPIRRMGPHPQDGHGMLPQGVVFASFNRVNNSPLFPTLTPNAKAYAIRIEVES